MLWKQMKPYARRTPPPISLLINTANAYSCNIFIINKERKINVKDYDELISNLKFRENQLLFIFDGTDEEDAQQHIERLFTQ